MRETVRLVAHDIVLIGWALCIIIVLFLLAMRLRIGYTWMQASNAIKSAVQTIIQTVINPVVAMTTVKQLWNDDKKSSKKEGHKVHGKKSPQKKSKKK
jgi:multisubunit Na+/H+ antiporter MnhG subunit